jgi:hypothetical protein
VARKVAAVEELKEVKAGILGQLGRGGVVLRSLGLPKPPDS